jgi:hypothetical protein
VFPWETISAEQYRAAFGRFGGSFQVHPRVVSLVAELANRPVHYVGLSDNGELIAAVPLWGEHIVATQVALKSTRNLHLIDIGESEVVLPLAEGVRITVPFIARMISNLHEGNIINLEREKRFNLTLAKGHQTGDHRGSSDSISKRCPRWTRRFQKAGGRFFPIGELLPDDTASIFLDLFRKRWDGAPVGKDYVSIVFRELRDFLYGDVLFLNDQPVGIRIAYKHETPRWLFVNGVQGGFDPEFGHYKLGNIMNFRNIERAELEAMTKNKQLRYGFGQSSEAYKEQWTYEVPNYRLASRP